MAIPCKIPMVYTHGISRWYVGHRWSFSLLHPIKYAARCQIHWSKLHKGWFSNSFWSQDALGEGIVAQQLHMKPAIAVTWGKRGMMWKTHGKPVENPWKAHGKPVWKENDLYLICWLFILWLFQIYVFKRLQKGHFTISYVNFGDSTSPTERSLSTKWYTNPEIRWSYGTLTAHEMMESWKTSGKFKLTEKHELWWTIQIYVRHIFCKLKQYLCSEKENTRYCGVSCCNTGGCQEQSWPLRRSALTSILYYFLNKI